MAAICSMCFGQRDCQPLRFGEEQMQVAEAVCRGCRIQSEKVEHYIMLAGFRIHLTKQPRLFTDEQEQAGRNGTAVALSVTDSGMDRVPAPPEPPTEPVEPPEGGETSVGTARGLIRPRTKP